MYVKIELTDRVHFFDVHICDVCELMSICTGSSNNISISICLSLLLRMNMNIMTLWLIIFLPGQRHIARYAIVLHNVLIFRLHSDSSLAKKNMEIAECDALEEIDRKETWPDREDDTDDLHLLVRI